MRTARVICIFQTLNVTTLDTFDARKYFSTRNRQSQLTNTQFSYLYSADNRVANPISRDVLLIVKCKLVIKMMADEGL